jgi:hypothetical protein
MSSSIKVFFLQKNEDGEIETESIWCDKTGNGTYIVDNIPFVAKNISLGDIIIVEYDNSEGQYYFDNLVSASGNTTIRIIMFDNQKIEETRTWLNNNKCDSEVLNAMNIIAVNIPKEIAYRPIKAFLDSGEQNDKWSYEESCLEHEY